MKKNLLFSLALCIGLSAAAQNSVRVPYRIAKIDPATANKSAQRSKPVVDEVVPFQVYSYKYNKAVAAATTLAPTETEIGTSTYDMQTNSCPRQQIQVHADGTISAVWTFSNDPATSGPTYTDRGTGYNYFSGTGSNAGWDLASPTTTRIENAKVGWGDIAVTNSGKEFVISHTPIKYVSRAAKGTGAWSVLSANLAVASSFQWQRTAVGGANGETIHVIGSNGAAYKGQAGAIAYYRSQDGGTTWDIVDKILPGIDSAALAGIGADNYNIDARGNNVAIVVGGMDMDVILLKSTDNGTTWTKKIAYDFPIPRYDEAKMISDVDSDGIADTINSNDGCVSVLLDNGNNAHVTFGNMSVLDTGLASGMSYFPTSDGLSYWNEGMGTNPPVMIAGIQDLNSNGMWDQPASGPSPTGFPMGLYYTSLTSYATLGIDAGGTLFIVYSSIVDGSDDSNGKAYRHVYAMASRDGGTTWDPPVDIQNDAFTEGYYCNIGRIVDANNIHIVYQADGVPGDALHGGNVDGPGNMGSQSKIIYSKLPKTDVVGVNEPNTNVFTVSNNYPNPFNKTTSIKVNLVKASDVNIEVVNALGQVVISQDNKNLNSGSHLFTLDGSKLASGLYIYTVKAGENSITKKMIVK